MKTNNERWSQEKAWDWYDKKPWLRGFNYLPADCCNRIALWQELDFDQHLATVDRELELAASIGFNSIRVILEFIVWDEQHDGFMTRFERFLETAAKHNIFVMVCFANDCVVPKDDKYRPQKLGPQSFDWGYHGGRKNSPHSGNRDTVGYNPVLDEPDTAERFYQMVGEIIGIYANDPRIVVWDLFNEPGAANRGDISVPHLQRMFDTARCIHAIQPLTTGIWHAPDKLSVADQLALELSDVVSYHNYWPYQEQVLEIIALRRYGRPLLITEWLYRNCDNNVDLMFPLFMLENIGCWHWGFVAGLSQTYEPNEGMWRAYEAGEKAAEALDFTKWMHDLLRPNLRPYDPKEIKIIKEFCTLADKK